MVAKFYGPLVEISRLQSELNRLFQTVMELSASPDFGGSAGTWTPSVDIVQSEDSVCVLVELPGVDPREVRIIVRGNILTISGQKRGAFEPTRQMRFVCMERYFGSFAKNIPMTYPVNTHRGKAYLANGILTITFDRVADKRDRVIELVVAAGEGEESGE